MYGGIFSVILNQVHSFWKLFRSVILWTKKRNFSPGILKWVDSDRIFFLFRGWTVDKSLINPVFVPLCSPIFGVPLQQTKAGFVPAPRAPGPRSGMWQLLFLTANPGISVLRVTPPSLWAIFLIFIYFFVLGCSWQMVATRCKKKKYFFKRLVQVAEQGGEWAQDVDTGWRHTPWQPAAATPFFTLVFFNILNFLLFFFHLYCWMCDFVL